MHTHVVSSSCRWQCVPIVVCVCVCVCVCVSECVCLCVCECVTQDIYYSSSRQAEATGPHTTYMDRPGLSWFDCEPDDRNCWRCHLIKERTASSAQAISSILFYAFSALHIYRLIFAFIMNKLFRKSVLVYLVNQDNYLQLTMYRMHQQKPDAQNFTSKKTFKKQV